MINRFEVAVRNNEVVDFLLGNGKYFYLNRDWGVHNYTRSWMDVMEYTGENEQGYQILGSGLVKLMQTGKKGEFFLICLFCLGNYLIYRFEENKTLQDWEIPKKINFSGP